MGGRTFLRRVLDLINTMPHSASKCRLTLTFHRDMEWWNNFLDTFNGKCDFLYSWPITDLQMDACVSGLSAFFKDDWFYSNLLVDTQHLAHLHVNYKETLGFFMMQQDCFSLL